MELNISPGLKSRKNADLLILPFFKSKDGVLQGADFDESIADWQKPVSVKDFLAEAGEILVLYPESSVEKRIALLGLGEKALLTTEVLRRCYSNAIKKANVKKVKSINLVLPDVAEGCDCDLIRGIVEGAVLTNYRFIDLKHDQLKVLNSSLVQKLVLIGADKADLERAKSFLVLCESVHIARNLVNGNADDITPQYLTNFAKEIAEELPKVTFYALGKKELIKEKMGLLLAVSRGASKDPALITLAYNGRPKAKEHVVIIGKGVTYDTGGLHLKPFGGMETMKCDMAGGAVALATIYAAAALKLKINVTAVVPATENCTDACSYKPGDVYSSHSGKTVEIGNTDAEGRLILADAISYSLKYLKPSCLIDIATLTGAIDVALGPEATGMFANNDLLADALSIAGQDSFERVWRLPLHEEYRDMLRSDFADIRNIGGRSAASITSAIFLQEFVGKDNKAIPWAHLDIASTAYFSEPRRYHPKFGSGVGVRLLISFLKAIEAGFVKL